ncbi:hypothetical protein EDB83DRAFT_2526378 [Lactarius deliciosus]|nr:hypothetical protein EDB83DRAFT_2526378 [Lactarius deliciosus]
MSQTPPMASSSSSSRAIFCASLEIYNQKNIQQFEQSITSGDDKLTKWLIPTVNVFYAFSAARGEGVGW